MYVPRHFEENDPATLHALVGAHPLGAWVTQSQPGGELLVNHVPFLLDPQQGERGTLACHVARANPVWKSFSTEVASVVVFQGAQTYVTPSWYASKREHGRVVPTWNYAVVHAHGLPRVMEDRDWLRRHLARMTDTQEAALASPWRIDDAPSEHIEALLGAIVGIEIPIARLVGKWKVSQNRSAADRAGAAAGLRERGDGQSVEMAGLIEKHSVPPGRA